MSGYCVFSKSNNAVAAESCGRFPASRAAKMLGVPVEFVRAQGASEWHHTSKHFNCTDYFDVEEIREHLDTPEGQEQLARIKTEIAAKSVAPVKVIENADVTWLEWGGTRNHPRATEMKATGCKIEDAGGKFVTVTFADGKTMRKGRDTRGFEVLVAGKRFGL